MKKALPFFISIIILTLAGAGVYWKLQSRIIDTTPNWSKPIESFGNELEKKDLINITTPRPNEIIKSPLTIKGQARGNWFFEGSFPVILTDWDGLIIAQGIATAEGEWTTTEFVPFSATLEFKAPAFKNNGNLILKKDNPSGLSKNDDALEIPILFSQ